MQNNEPIIYSNLTGFELDEDSSLQVDLDEFGFDLENGPDQRQWHVLDGSYNTSRYTVQIMGDHDNMLHISLAENQTEGRVIATPAPVGRSFFVRAEGHLYRIEE